MKSLFATESKRYQHILIVLVLCVAMYLADTQTKVFQPAKEYNHLLLEKVYQLVNLPSNLYFEISKYISDRKKLNNVNQELLEENLILKAKLIRLDELEKENVELKSILQVKQSKEDNFITTKVLKVNFGPLVDKVVLDRGHKNEVFLGQPVIDSDGIVGAVTKVYKNTSELMLITDSDSVIPVYNSRTKLRALAKGSGQQNQLSLLHITNSQDIAVGDVMLTSALGGSYPRGYPVGEVVKIKRHSGKQFASIILKPIASLDTARLLLLIRN